jgi:hypothetical protein
VIEAAQSHYKEATAARELNPSAGRMVTSGRPIYPAETLVVKRLSGELPCGTRLEIVSNPSARIHGDRDFWKREVEACR